MCACVTRLQLVSYNDIQYRPAGVLESGREREDPWKQCTIVSRQAITWCAVYDLRASSDLQCQSGPLTAFGPILCC